MKLVRGLERAVEVWPQMYAAPCGMRTAVYFLLRRATRWAFGKRLITWPVYQQMRWCF